MAGAIITGLFLFAGMFLLGLAGLLMEKVEKRQ